MSSIYTEITVKGGYLLKRLIRRILAAVMAAVLLMGAAPPGIEAEDENSAAETEVLETADCPTEEETAFVSPEPDEQQIDADSGISLMSFNFGGYGWDTYGLGYNPICSDPSKLAWIETFTSNTEYSKHPWRSNGNIGLDGSPQNITINDYPDIKNAAGTAYGWFYPIRIDCETGFGNGQRWIAMDGIPGWLGSRTAASNQYSDFRFWDTNSYTQQASPPGTKWTTIPDDVAQAMYAAIQCGPSGKGNDEVDRGNLAVHAVQIILINLELGFWSVDSGAGYVTGRGGLKSISNEVNQEVVDILAYVDTYMWYYKHGSYGDPASIAAADSAKKTLVENSGAKVPVISVQPHVNTVSGKLTSNGVRTVYSHGGSSNQDQAMVYLAAFELEWGVKSFPVGIKKISGNSGITDGNGCYSLAGAVYGIYSDPACNTLLERITTNSGGIAESKNQYEPGTIYIKEISPSPGYLLDTTVYSVAIDDSGNIAVK